MQCLWGHNGFHRKLPYPNLLPSTSLKQGWERSLEAAGASHSSKTSHQGTHLSSSPPANPCTFSSCKTIMQKVAAPAHPAQLSGHPKKEKLKLPQVSYRIARLQQSPHRCTGVIAWSPPWPQHCMDGSHCPIPQPRRLQQRFVWIQFFFLGAKLTSLFSTKGTR